MFVSYGTTLDKWVPTSSTQHVMPEDREPNGRVPFSVANSATAELTSQNVAASYVHIPRRNVGTRIEANPWGSMHSKAGSITATTYDVIVLADVM